ncbi:MAG: BON domain-containing protein [Pseudomonadota bacterium]
MTYFKAHMSQHRTALAWMALLVAMAVLPGCQSYREGERRTVGEFTDDVAIKTRVQAALIADAEVKGLVIEVRVRRGVVTLFGRVPSPELKTRVTNLAAAVRGVDRVDNRLTIVT